MTDTWTPPYRSAPVTAQSINQLIKDTYLPAIEQNMYKTNPILRKCIADAYDEVGFQTQKEKKMNDETIVNEIVEARKRERAADVYEVVITKFNEMDAESGAMVQWSVEFDNSDKTYEYAAVRGEKYWYVTRDVGEYSTELLVAKIVTLVLKGKVWFEGEEL